MNCEKVFFCAICDITFLAKALSSWHEYQPHFSWCFANCAKLPSRLVDKEAAKEFLTGRLILPCGEKMYGNSMEASVCNRQNVIRVSMAFVEEKKVLTWRKNREAAGYIIPPLRPKFQNKFLFLCKKQLSWNKTKNTRLCHHWEVCLFLRERKMSKTFFPYHVVKEKEKNSGNHFMPSAGTFIKSPDCACMK